MKIKADYVNEPQWKILTVKATLPAELKCLAASLILKNNRYKNSRLFKWGIGNK